MDDWDITPRVRTAIQPGDLIAKSERPGAAEHALLLPSHGGKEVCLALLA